MLRIQDVCVQVARDVKPLAAAIAECDRDLARQLRKSMASVPLNTAEAHGNRGGNRRVRYETALGSAREALVTLEVAEALGYIGPIDAGLRDRFDRITATLFKLAR